MENEANFNVLVRMPNWLGDCVMAMPAVRHLVDALPKARIFLSGREQFRDLFRAQKGVAGFVPAPTSGFGHLFRGMSGIRHVIRKADIPGGIDLGVLLTNSLSTAAWLWRTGSKMRLGYNRDCRRHFLTHPIPCGGVETSMHLVAYYLWLAKCAEAVAFETERASRRHVDPTAEYLAPSIRVGDQARERARALLAAEDIHGEYAVIAPASAYGAVKDWPPEYWRELVAMLNVDLGLPVVVTGSSGQADVCRKIAAKQEAAVDVSGRTGLDVFAGLLAGASAFAGGDSGGAHVAAALDVPTVVIFGVTSPTRTRAGGKAVRILGGVEGAGLRLKTGEARRKAKEALAAISPEQVMQAVVAMREKGDNRQ